MFYKNSQQKEGQWEHFCAANLSHKFPMLGKIKVDISKNIHSIMEKVPESCVTYDHLKV